MEIDPQRPVRMIEAAGTTDQIRRAYDLWSAIYVKVAGPLERGPRLRALGLSGIQPRNRVLEAAVGTGSIFLEILKGLDKGSVAYGIDLSSKMLQKTRELIQKSRYHNGALAQADARRLPFQSQTFDVVYSSYLLDLLELSEIPKVLDEFKRVLKPGGRLILVNLSREHAERISWMERLYSWLPTSWVPYLLGSCRPVFMEGFLKSLGFIEVQREFSRHLTHSEIVMARKPTPHP